MGKEVKKGWNLEVERKMMCSKSARFQWGQRREITEQASWDRPGGCGQGTGYPIQWLRSWGIWAWSWTSEEKHGWKAEMEGTWMKLATDGKVKTLKGQSVCWVITKHAMMQVWAEEDCDPQEKPSLCLSFPKEAILSLPWEGCEGQQKQPLGRVNCSADSDNFKTYSTV